MFLSVNNRSHMINIENIDCMIRLKEAPDNYWDLAVVDPPYGLTKGMDKRNQIPKNSNVNSINDNLYSKVSQWNKAPDKSYFDELKRVSKNWIVWGGNYFPSLWVEPSRGFIFWDKMQFSKLHADGELAQTSFDRNCKLFRYRSCGNHLGTGQMGKRIHPTQKPIPLYIWILNNYANHGDRILETHLGSGSIAIACHDMGFHLDGYELDEEYYNAAMKRLKNHQRQLKLF